MLSLYSPAGRQNPPADLRDASLPPDILWIDLLRPEPGERAFVEAATGLRLPSLEELSEIESSSRLRTDDGVLYLSASLISRSRTDNPTATPVGFVLAPHRLITIRYEPLPAFEQLGEGPHQNAAEMFASLLETIIDRIADGLEHIAGELDALSHRLFRSGAIETGGLRRPAQEDRDLRAALKRVGAHGDLASKIRDSLLGLGRMVPYVAGLGASWLPEPVKPRLETMRHDIASLSDYDAHLLNKVQLLLDATLGLINIEQNNIIKVLTVVSVVGVPPTLIASMYGMNFKNIPEYDWSFGYEWGLALIAISAIAPLLWFKWRGWF